MTVFTFTDHDGAMVTIAADSVMAVMEANGASKAQGCHGLVALKGPTCGITGFSAKETHDELAARWKSALGLTNSMN